MLQGMAVGTDRSWVTEALTAAGSGATASLSSESTDERIGTIVGSYLLRSRIGAGAMGDVYMAEHVRLGRRVAIKVLRAEVASWRSAQARFLREARIVAGIRHRNIVLVEDLVEPAAGPPYLVMELLRGSSLRDHLRVRGALAADEVVEMGAQICCALEVVHGAGVLHRDLTPGNVHLCDERSDGWIKLLDFGIAKRCEPAGGDDLAPVTAEGTIIGTPGYMSPEQATGGPVDARSDLYALGAILYEATCGVAAITGACVADYVRAHVATAPRPLRKTGRGRGAPAALEALVMRCLAKRPEQRPASAAVVRAELLALRAATGLRSRRRRAGAMVFAAATAAIGGALSLAPETVASRPPHRAAVLAPAAARAVGPGAAASRPIVDDDAPLVGAADDCASPAPARAAAPRRRRAPASAPSPVDPARTLDPFATGR